MAARKVTVFGQVFRTSSSGAYLIVAAPFVSPYDGKPKEARVVGFAHSGIAAESRCEREFRRLGRGVVAVNLSSGKPDYGAGFGARRLEEATRHRRVVTAY